jgi:hypothetical protein
MEIEFDLTEPDILALMHYQLRRVPRARHPMQVRRFSYVVGFALLALGFWLTMQNAILPAVFLALAVVALLFYPAIFEWLLRRQVALAFKDPHKRVTFGTRTMRTSSEGIVELSELGMMAIRWPAITDLTATATHAFLTVQARAAMVIPAARVRRGDYARFLEACRSFMGGALADEAPPKRRR